MATVDEIIAIKERVEAQFLGAPGVTGVDVGYKEVGGQATDQVAIRVHVAAKTDDIPADQRVPAEIEGVLTDVLERRYELQVLTQQVAEVSPQADTTHYATLQGGVSMGPSRVVNGSIFAGTLGAIVIDSVSNQHAALTNFHVACVDSTFTIGDRMVQPSRIDTGVVPADEFGSLARETLSANVDGAVIAIDSGRASQCEIADIGAVRGTAAAALGMAVRKRGRTTLLTYGSVDGVSGSVTIDYGDGIGSKTLTNQISIATDTTRNPLFSDHGDSGSVIVNDSGFVVGLLFAGSGTSTVANPIAAVLSELNISICVGKSIIKDIKDGRKDLIKDGGKDLVKDKEVRKELIKEKEFRKDLIKDKELVKDSIKDKEIKETKELVSETSKLMKDVRDAVRKPVAEIPGQGPGPVETQPGGQAALEQRLAAMEQRLGQLTGFIGPDQRPDLAGSAYSGEPASAEPALGDADVTQLRAELQQQVDQAVAAKAELDAPYA
jgi:hypothetical protein